MKRISMKEQDAENRLTLDSVMTEVDTEAADEQAAEKAYAEKVAALDVEAAAEQAEIARRKADVDAAAKALDTIRNNAPKFTLARDDTSNAKSAVFDGLSSFGASLDLSAIRAKFVQYGDDIADALTEFVGTSAVENVALPICRLRALGRIAYNKSAFERISAMKTVDGKTTYGKTKSPFSRFLMDTLELSKQQISTYMRVLRECVDKDSNELKPEFRGFSFSQLDVLSASKAPSENAVSVDAELSMRDFKEAVAKLDTIRATTAANKPDVSSGQSDESKPDVPSGQPDESKPDVPSGQPDESKPDESKPDTKAADNLVSFVVGNIPEGNQFNFNPITKADGKPVVIRAANLTAAVTLFTDTSNDSDRIMFRLPKATEKAIVDKLPASFTGYSVKAIVGDIKGYMGRASLYAIATVETVGTDENAETTKQAAKRIETARTVLANWLTGAAELQGIPAAVNLTNPMEIFKKAYDMVQNVARMSGQLALAELVKSGDFQMAKPEDFVTNKPED